MLRLISALHYTSVLLYDDLGVFHLRILTRRCQTVVGEGTVWLQSLYLFPIELEDHVPVYIPEPEHPEDLVPAEDEAPTPPLPPFFLSPRIRPPHTRAAMRQMRAAAPSTYHSLLPSGTPPLLPIPLPAPSTSRRADIPEADTPPRKRLLLTTPRPECEVGESSAAAAARQPGPTMAHRVDCSSVDTIETRIRDTERRMMTAFRNGQHESLAADDPCCLHIMRTLAMVAGARVDTLVVHLGSSSLTLVMNVATMQSVKVFYGLFHS
ncbi:hypothetical protein Tco_0312496 [Tanacetum coccineum]